MPISETFVETRLRATVLAAAFWAAALAGVGLYYLSWPAGIVLPAVIPLGGLMGWFWSPPSVWRVDDVRITRSGVRSSRRIALRDLRSVTIDYGLRTKTLTFATADTTLTFSRLDEGADGFRHAVGRAIAAQRQHIDQPRISGAAMRSLVSTSDAPP